MIRFVTGDMFAEPYDVRVNTVNCAGVMGAGVALAFKQRYPEMFSEYKRECKEGRIRPGCLHVWQNSECEWIVNFPTKRHRRDKSRSEKTQVVLEVKIHVLEPHPMRPSSPDRSERQ